MAHDVAETTDELLPSATEPEDPRPRRRRWKVLAAVGALVLLLVVAAALWFFLGRDKAEQLTTDDALTDFRDGAGTSEAAEGLPAAGVYAATATGSESIGLPGFDERLGPNAPVTVTHGEDGCFTYRVDFNSHHWRSWTYCPTATATFALTELDTWTARKAPGLDIETLTTYACDQPLDLVWDGAVVGDARTGACTGTTDMDDSVTADVGRVEVLEVGGSLTIDGDRVPVTRLRTSDTFSGDQTGTEVGEWWLDATTGLPLKFAIEAHVKGASDYSEDPTLELSTLTPAT